MTEKIKRECTGRGDIRSPCHAALLSCCVPVTRQDASLHQSPPCEAAEVRRGRQASAEKSCSCVQGCEGTALQRNPFLSFKKVHTSVQSSFKYIYDVTCKACLNGKRSHVSKQSYFLFPPFRTGCHPRPAHFLGLINPHKGVGRMEGGRARSLGGFEVFLSVLSFGFLCSVLPNEDSDTQGRRGPNTQRPVTYTREEVHPSSSKC